MGRHQHRYETTSATKPIGPGLLLSPSCRLLSRAHPLYITTRWPLACSPSHQRLPQSFQSPWMPPLTAATPRAAIAFSRRWLQAQLSVHPIHPIPIGPLGKLRLLCPHSMTQRPQTIPLYRHLTQRRGNRSALSPTPFCVQIIHTHLAPNCPPAWIIKCTLLLLLFVISIYYYFTNFTEIYRTYIRKENNWWLLMYPAGVFVGEPL